MIYLIGIFFLWIVSLVYSIRLSSQENIQAEIFELRKLKFEKILEIQEKRKNNQITSNECQDMIKKIMSVLNKHTFFKVTRKM